MNPSNMNITFSEIYPALKTSEVRNGIKGDKYITLRFPTGIPANISALLR